MQRTTSNFPHRAGQTGLALVIVMMFLTAITGITIWAVRQSLMGEGLARNELDQVVARQAAEAALRDAERDILGITAAILPDASCTRNNDPPLRNKGFTSTCNLGLCDIDPIIYATADWPAPGVAPTPANAEPWWPTDKGGQWNNNFVDTDILTRKPQRTAIPVDTTSCTFVGGVPLGTFTGAAPIPSVAQQPQYLIEYFSRASRISLQPTPHYRITARGFGYTQRTQVVLQTIFVPLLD